MKRILSIVLVLLSLSLNTFAGNSDRIGESGAPELIMNGWARSTGLWDLNTSRVMGLGAMRLNPAGLSFVKKMDIALAYTQWFAGSDVALYQLGFASKLGADNVVGVSIMSMDPGHVYRTTDQNPDPNNSLGSFKPSYFNIGLTFSRSFSSRIHGGITVRLINESIESVNAFGFALDAGLQYVLGDKENARFGVSIRNLGTPMRFRGDGFSFRGNTPDADDYLIALEPGINEFQLPSLLTLGASYDFWLGDEFTCNGGYNIHRVTVLGSYISNSMGKDNYGLGAEYAFKEMFMARVAYRYEDGLLDPTKATSFNSGLSAGFSVEVPFKTGGPSLGIDYSYRHTTTLAGTHSMGLTFKVGDPDNPCLSSSDKDNDEGADAFVEEEEEEVVVVKKKKKKKKKVEVEAKAEPVIVHTDTMKFINEIDRLKIMINDYERQIKDLETASKIEKKEAKVQEQEIFEKISAAINFDTGSDNLSLGSKQVLDLLEVFLKKNKSTLKIDAYTDNVGKAESNLKLSEDRAKAVKNYLTSIGLNENRITSKGHGISDTFDNKTKEGRAQNRRVEIAIK